MLDGIDDADLAAAAALRAEWRADELEWTRAALERWEHDRTLADVLRACMHRGDTVALELPGCTFTGVVAAVAVDLVRLATTEGSVDAQLAPTGAFVLRVVEPARAGGQRGDETIASFRARLLQLEGAMTRVGLSARADELTGRLCVGRDQLGVIDRDGVRRYVPIASVAWVRPLDVD
ncbi:MAG: hypothetical protein QOF40_1484 [Actinomycetota bacterium]|nr:hypothetical protein [Actinomycetota bacterium]